MAELTMDIYPLVRLYSLAVKLAVLAVFLTHVTGCCDVDPVRATEVTIDVELRAQTGPCEPGTITAPTITVQLEPPSIDILPEMPCWHDRGRVICAYSTRAMGIFDFDQRLLTIRLDLCTWEYEMVRLSWS